MIDYCYKPFKLHLSHTVAVEDVFYVVNDSSSLFNVDLSGEEISSGWFLVRSSMERKGASFSPELWVRTTDDEVYSVNLPISLKGNLLELVYLPYSVVSLQFSPLAGQGRVRFDSFSI